jgi:peptidoglycan/LPS O-acetylase OafA/YrhL
MGVRAAVGRVPALDGMRGIAVLWVIAFHYGALGDSARDPWLLALDSVPVLDAVVRNGYLGVDLFFLISGFLLVLPWFVRRDSDLPPPDVCDFYVRRARRIVPAYYVQLALLFLLFVPLLRGWDYWRKDLYVIAWNALAHAGFLHTTSPLTSGTLGVNGALWTLAVEAHYYLLLPLLAPLFVRAPALTAVGAFALAALWQAGARHDLDALVALQTRLGAHWGWPEAIVRHLLLTQLPSYLGHFALGTVLGRVWLLWRGGDGPVLRWLPVAALLALALLLHALGTGEAVLGEQTWVATTLALGTLLLAAPLARGRLVRAVLDRGPLAFVGRVSYSAYLYHLPLLLLWQHYAVPVPAYLAAPLYLACVLSVAWLSWRFVEERFRFIQRRRSSGA